MIGRIIIWGILVVALILLGRDVVLWLDKGRFTATPLGQVWYSLDPGSLNLLQAVIERYVHPYLWDPIIFTVLAWPAFAVIGVPALALALIAEWRARRRKPRKFARKS